MRKFLTEAAWFFTAFDVLMAFAIWALWGFRPEVIMLAAGAAIGTAGLINLEGQR